MEMVGVIWVAGPQYGREPSAARAPHRLPGPSATALALLDAWGTLRVKIAVAGLVRAGDYERALSG